MRVLVFLLCVACGGSAPSAYRLSLAQGERDQSSGRYSQAVVAFDEAARNAQNPRDKEYAQYLAAEMVIKSGDVAGGCQRLAVIANATPPGERAPAAAYELVRMHLETAQPTAWQELDAFILKFPSSGLARPALHRALEHRVATQGDAGGIAYLDALAVTLAQSELSEEIAYARALKLAGRDAEKAFVAIADKWPYPRGTHFDDSLFRASELAETDGRPRDALVYLGRMLDELEHAHMMGSYIRPRFPDAMWKMATIYDHMSDRDKARDTYRKFFRTFTASTKRDDALWEEAKLWEKDGKHDEACSALGLIVSDVPDSRYVPCVVVRCNVTRPKESRAPTTCHAYIDKT